MNEYIASIETLFRTKKENNKKEPTLAEKSEFMTSWTKLVKENGYDGKAEQFLYEGFSFCGAEPFYQFFKQTSDQNSAVEQLFSGQQYGKDSKVTFKLITHLFALMLNDEAPSSILSPVIKHFPSACRNKEGKQLGTAIKTMEKYFLNVLSPAVELQPLTEINLNSEVLNSFICVFSSLIGELKQVNSLKEPAISNVEKIEKWARNYLDTTGNNAQGETQKEAEAASDMQVAGNPEVPASAGKKKATVRLDSLQEVLIYAQALTTQLTRENEEQKQRIIELESKVHDNSLRLTEASQKLEVQQSTITGLNEKKIELEHQCRTLQYALEEKEKLLKEKDVEIAERIKMSEVLSRDRSKQAEESLQRIASNIKVEYRDFKDALDAPMTVDLGENLRLQLMSIFEILQKGGMKID